MSNQYNVVTISKAWWRHFTMEGIYDDANLAVVLQTTETGNVCAGVNPELPEYMASDEFIINTGWLIFAVEQKQFGRLVKSTKAAYTVRLDDDELETLYKQTEWMTEAWGWAVQDAYNNEERMRALAVVRSSKSLRDKLHAEFYAD
jgi:hypothetical protein